MNKLSFYHLIFDAAWEKSHFCRALNFFYSFSDIPTPNGSLLLVESLFIFNRDTNDHLKSTTLLTSCCIFTVHSDTHIKAVHTIIFYSVTNVYGDVHVYTFHTIMIMQSNTQVYAIHIIVIIEKLDPCFYPPFPSISDGVASSSQMMNTSDLHGRLKS